MSEDEERQTKLINEWTKDAINRALDSLWGSALDSQAEDYVDADGNVGHLDEAGYIRKKTNAMRRAREELDRLYWEKI